MTPRPQPVERLEKRLARVAREEGLDQERLRRWVSFLAMCGVLEKATQEGLLGSYFLKGGAALELRFATHVRATKDLDLALEGARAERLDSLRRALALGFDDFTFRVKAPTRDMAQADTVRVTVAVLYRTRSWQSIEVDLGPGFGKGYDFVEPQVRGLAELGLPVTSPIRCLGLPEQAAQKIHACTGPKSAGRARDILDILMIDMLAGLDRRRTAQAVAFVFTDRATHAFPEQWTLPPEWRREVEVLAEQIGLPKIDSHEVESRFAAILHSVRP